MRQYNSRSEVPEKYKWNLDDYFKSEEEFRQYFKKTEEMIPELSHYIGCCLNSDKLYEYLSKSIEIAARIMNLYGYCYLVNDQELGNSDSVERLNKSLSLDSKYEAVNSFFAPELLRLSKEEYTKLFENKKLDEFRIYLDQIYCDKEYILSEKEEKVIASISSSLHQFEEISSSLLNSEHNYGRVIIKGREEQIATNNYSHLMKNKDVNIRLEVYEKMNRVLSQYGGTCAKLLNGYVSMNNTLAQLHHFSGAWEKKLHSNHLSNHVYTSLVHAAESNLDILHQYYHLKKKALGFDTLHPYDLYLSPTSSDLSYSIEEAKQMVLNAIQLLGDDYYSRFKRIFDERHIDYCQYKGKSNGGYNLSTLDKNSKILMNYKEDLLSVSTIAHEGGHFVNHEYITENNPIQYRDLRVVIAEVASLTNEFLLSNYLLENSKSLSEKLNSLENLLDLFVSNFFGSVREGKMEQEMYDYVSKGSSLTKEFLDGLSYSSLEKYYGDAVELDSYCKNGWIKRSHYYMDFYLYSYAICISVAVVCAKKILSKDRDFVAKYIKFLSTGSDIYPIDVYKILGINLEGEKIYQEAIEYFASLMDKYSDLIAERK